jgi:hypothetical protein
METLSHIGTGRRLEYLITGGNIDFRCSMMLERYKSSGKIINSKYFPAPLRKQSAILKRADDW